MRMGERLLLLTKHRSFISDLVNTFLNLKCRRNAEERSSASPRCIYTTYVVAMASQEGRNPRHTPPYSSGSPNESFGYIGICPWASQPRSAVRAHEALNSGHRGVRISCGADHAYRTWHGTMARTHPFGVTCHRVEIAWYSGGFFVHEVRRTDCERYGQVS